MGHNPNCKVEGPYRLSGFSHNRSCSEVNTAEKLMSLVHSPEHIDKIKGACKNHYTLAEARLSPESYISCVSSLNLGLEAAIENNFALIHPPGHHAKRNEAKGLCLFNNMAILAKYLQENGERVFIYDFDVHHGDGTQDIFYKDPEVFYFSTHEEGKWPYTGDTSEIGEAGGRGSNANLPLPMGAGDDILKDSLDVAAKLIWNFNPTKIGISAGFDAYSKDPLGNLNFSLGGYQYIGRFFRELGVPTFAVLEGGYHNDVYDCTRAFVDGINGIKIISPQTKSDVKMIDHFQETKDKLLEKLD